MDSPASNKPDRKKNSWGDVIAILIILLILAYGAYYVFTDRLSTLPETPTALAE